MPLLRISQFNTKEYPNPGNHDRMIFIEGLPERLVEINPGGNMWRYDVIENIQDDVKRKFNIFDINDVPVPERTVDGKVLNQNDMKDLRDKKWLQGKNLALVIEYPNSNGERIVDEIMATLKREMPRDIAVPAPVVIGDRRGWTIKADDIPCVDLREKQVDTTVVQQAPSAESLKEMIREAAREMADKMFEEKMAAMVKEKEAEPEPVKVDKSKTCVECGRIFPDGRGLHMHMAGHKFPSAERAKAVA